VRTMRWQGTNSAAGLRPQAVPAARTALGLAHLAASWPYVSGLPAGIRRSCSHARSWNGVEAKRTGTSSIAVSSPPT
jgi:hypothetical protein